MAIYSRKKTRATKKRRGRPTSNLPTAREPKRRAVVRPARKVAKRAAKSPVKKKRAAVAAKARSRRPAKKVVVKKRAAAAPKKRAVTPKKPAAAKKAVAPKKAVAAKKPVAKKPAAKKAAAKKPVAKKAVTPKKAAAKKAAPKKVTRKKAVTATPKKPVAPKKTAAAKKQAAKKRTTRQLAKELETVKGQLRRLRKRELAARGTSKESAEKRSMRARKKAIQERRAKRAVAIEKLPRATTRAENLSRLENYRRMRKRFWDLYREAQRLDQIPEARKRLPPRIDSVRNIGEQRRIRIKRLLRPEVTTYILDRVDAAARTMSGQYSTWLASISFSSLGERLVGYGTKVLDTKDPDARFFQTQGFDSTGLFESYVAMMDALQRKLEDYASSPRTVVYVHFVKLMNFDRKRPWWRS